jgi:hypothetical protein
MTALTLNDYIKTIEPTIDSIVWGDTMEQLECICEVNQFDENRAISVLSLLVYHLIDDNTHDNIVTALQLIDPICQSIDELAAAEDELCDYPDPYAYDHRHKSYYL